MPGPTSSQPLSRRAVLAGATAVTTATAGCINRLQSVVGGPQGSQLTLEIKTLPLDSDPFAVKIANQLRAALNAVGIDTRLTVMTASELTRQVFLNHDFDIYVGQFPYSRPPDPDVCNPLFRSTFASDHGWQNPFGFTDLSIDDLLDAQRTTSGELRRGNVAELQRLVARSQPITPLVAPEVLTGVRTDRFTRWNPPDRDQALGGPTQPHNLLQLESVDDHPKTLRLATVDNRITTNRNPISGAYRQEGTMLDLVYDSLALDRGSEYIPWLAREITWVDGGGAPKVEVRLRDGLRWHDGQQLSAYDVGFTYAFLQDTSLGAAIRPIPAERFGAHVSTIEDVTVTNSRRLTITFAGATETIAKRALTVPILPAHIWRRRTQIDRGSDRAARTTLAITTPNQSAVGSGPLQFAADNGDTVEFARFDDHFLWRSALAQAEDDDLTHPSNESTESSLNDSTDEQPDEASLNDSTDEQLDGTSLQAAAQPSDESFAPLPEAFGGRPAFDSVTVRVVSADGSAVELLTSGAVDATMTNLGPETSGDIEDDPDLERIAYQSNGFYHLGFNTRRQPLRNPNVRRLIARLVDKAALADETFGGYGVPIASPLAGTDWLADSLRWDDETGLDPEVPFIGTDGELAVERVRERFRSLGYQFTADNELITQIR